MQGLLERINISQFFHFRFYLKKKLLTFFNKIIVFGYLTNLKTEGKK